MKRKTNRKIIALMLMLAMLVSTVTVFGDSRPTPINVNYYGSFERAYYQDTVPMYYSDSYFDKAATVESDSIEHLATASMIMALAASYSDTTLVQAALQNSAMGFDHPESRDYGTRSNSDTIGVVVSDKTIDDETMLVAVQVRGAYYGYEWGQNFITDKKDSKFNKYKDADGYGIPAGKVCDMVNEHVGKYKADAKGVKIWITGYSRGGAVANLAARTLSDKYGKRNVYSFSFDSPKASGKKGCKYTNIRNYQNSSDPIAYFLPGYMGFDRNGQKSRMLDKSKNEDQMVKNLLKMADVSDRDAVEEDYRGLDNFKWTRFKLNLNLASLGVLVDAIKIITKNKDIYEFNVSNKPATTEQIMKALEQRLKYAVPSRKEYVESGMQDGLTAVGILAQDHINFDGLLDLLKEPETLLGLAKNPYLFKAVREIQRCGKPRMTDCQYKSIANTINEVLVDKFAWNNEGQKKTAKIAVNGLIKPLIKYLAVDYNAKYQTLGTLLNIQNKEDGVLNIMRLVQCHYTDVNLAWALCNDSYYDDFAPVN